MYYYLPIYLIRPNLFLADSRVLDNNIAIDIGPIPPGTGVMAEAILETSLKQTSPTSL